MRAHLLILALAACGSTPAKVIDHYKADVLARGDDLAAIAAMLDGQPAQDPPPLDPSANFDIERADQNAVVVEGDELRAIVAGTQTVRIGVGQYDQFDDALALARTGKLAYGGDSPNADYTEKPMRRLAHLRYLLVLVADAYAKPTSLDEHTFAGGGWRGNALLYDVPARRYLGGWPVGASSSQQVNGMGEVSGAVFLDDDLSMAVEREVCRSVRAKLRGGTPPDLYLCD